MTTGIVLLVLVLIIGVIFRFFSIRLDNIIGRNLGNSFWEDEMKDHTEDKPNHKK